MSVDVIEVNVMMQDFVCRCHQQKVMMQASQMMMLTNATH
jgi:hypothetical protein